MATFPVRLAAAMVLGLGSAAVSAQNREPSPLIVIEPVLERFVEDYAHDPQAQDITFGIEVDGLRWTVTSNKTETGRDVRIARGFGDQAMIYFKTDRETLNLLDQGVWNGLTAMGAASSADKTPLDILVTDGFEKGSDYDATIRPLIFHFWTRGTPEIVRFGAAHSRVVHGAPASALYYDEDFRSAVYRVPAGLGREQAPTISVPFKRMVLVIGGSGEGVIGDRPFTMRAGDMVLSPPNIPVTFWNASDEEPLEFVWLMWGEGA